MTPIPFSKTNVLLKFDEYLQALNKTHDSLVDNFKSIVNFVDPYEYRHTICNETSKIVPKLDYVKDELSRIEILKGEIEKMPIGDYRGVTSEVLRDAISDKLLQVSECLKDEKNKTKPFINFPPKR